jgi:hypothetical protein
LLACNPTSSHLTGAVLFSSRPVNNLKLGGIIRVSNQY